MSAAQAASHLFSDSRCHAARAGRLSITKTRRYEGHEGRHGRTEDSPNAGRGPAFTNERRDQKHKRLLAITPLAFLISSFVLPRAARLASPVSLPRIRSPFLHFSCWILAAKTARQSAHRRLLECVQRLVMSNTSGSGSRASTAFSLIFTVGRRSSTQVPGRAPDNCS